MTNSPAAGPSDKASRPGDARRSPIDDIRAKALEAEVIETLRQCYDPEIPVNIYDLGLIYDVQIDPQARVDIKMTLTSPACPVAGTLPLEVESRVKGIDGVSTAGVEIVWEPQWTPERMSEAARLQLNI